MFKPITADNKRMMEQLFQEVISADKATILNEKGGFVLQATVIYSAYYQMGKIFYKINDALLWEEIWYIS